MGNNLIKIQEDQAEEVIQMKVLQIFILMIKENLMDSKLKQTREFLIDLGSSSHIMIQFKLIKM